MEVPAIPNLVSSIQPSKSTSPDAVRVELSTKQ